METIDIKLFRKVNNLTQTELGNYLGCTKAFVSAIEKGVRPLPKEMLSKLIYNSLNWDTSVLNVDIPTHAPILPQPKTEVMQSQEEILIAELRSQIEKLESKIDNLNQELGEKNALIKMMRKGGEESAQGADYSLSASAI